MAHIWFITGASSGFGRAMAEYALAQRNNVVGVAHRADALDAFSAPAPDRFLAISADVASGKEVDRSIRVRLSHRGHGYGN